MPGVVLRLFDDELAHDIKQNFNVDAIISRSAVAAMSFAYAAVGGHVLETFNRNHQSYVLSQLAITPASPLLDNLVRQLSTERDVIVVAHYDGSKLIVEPSGDTILQPQDTIFVFTTVEQMLALIEENQPPESRKTNCGLVLVCGLGIPVTALPEFAGAWVPGGGHGF
jgi:Trk K+ transport system NAD-binding subunit